MPDNKMGNAAENSNEKIPESEVSRLIKAVRQADSYDNIGPELYYEMCHKKEPPYAEWVATWLLKCIEKTFSKYPYKSDIMRASFALLPEYDLESTTVQERLECYLDESNYLLRYPSKSKRSLDDIKSDPNSQKELDDIKKKLIRMDNHCLNELIKYIEELPNARSHIEDLMGYGTLISLPNGKQGFKPKLKGLYRPRRKCNVCSGDSGQKELMPPDAIDGNMENSEDDSMLKVRAGTESVSKKDTSILPDKKSGKGQSSDNSTDDGEKHKDRKWWFIVLAIGISIGFAITFLFFNINKDEYDQPADGSIYQPTPSMKVNRPDGTSLEFYGQDIKYEETSDGYVIESTSGEKKSLTGQLNKTVIGDDYMLEGADESDKNY